MARILIVDDSAVARKSLREIVISLAHTVVGEAENGTQAFVEYTRLKPDIVTMDLTMQGMSGAETTSKLIATFPEARIIVISAMEERRVVLDALERGARHFIIKPINQEKVASVLTNVLQQVFDKHKHRELVRKMKGMGDPASVRPENVYMPPHQIMRDGSLTIIKVNANLTMTSCQSLAIEMEEYLTGEPKMLFDFGVTAGFDKKVLAEVDKLIRKIEEGPGILKAVSRNSEFVDLVNTTAEAPALAAIIRYLPN